MGKDQAYRRVPVYCKILLISPELIQLRKGLKGAYKRGEDAYTWGAYTGGLITGGLIPGGLITRV